MASNGHINQVHSYVAFTPDAEAQMIYMLSQCKDVNRHPAAGHGTREYSGAKWTEGARVS